MSFRFNAGAVNKLDKNIQKCLEMTGEALHGEVITAQVMPFDEGTMQDEETFVDTSNSRRGVVSLVTTSPQARRLYFHPEYDFQTINNPNAKGQWLENWMKDGKDARFAHKAFSEFLKRRL